MDSIEQAVECWVQQEDDARRWRALLSLVTNDYGAEAAAKLAAQVEREIQRGEKG